MITIQISRDDDLRIQGFTVSGHALFAKAGDDIICAAVSMITINTVNAIEEFLPDEKSDVTVNREEGFISFKLKESPTKESELLLQTFRLGVVSIEEQYGRKFVKVIEDMPHHEDE